MATTKKTSRAKKTVARSSRARTQVMPEPQAMNATPAAPVAQAAPAMNNILVIVLIILAFFAGYFYFKAQNLEKGAAAGGTKQAQQQPAAPTNLKIKKPSTDEHWRGNKDARIVMVEYSDLECPFCKRIHPDLVKLYNDNGGKVAWVFRHFPLSFHPKAQKSAESTECVTKELGNDGFWKMTDAIYEKMPTIELADLPATAASVGANEGTVKQCIDAGDTASVVKADQDEGTKIGVQATPTTVFYDTKTGKSQTVEGAVPYDQLKQVLDTMLKG
ncbi:DsbA family protein [Candidatus Microgenomates bacterium]|nr:DsbA family protein [Candidatus Microgenomates bacterium]